MSVLSIRGATLRFGARTLWSDLDLEVAPGEFIAVIGANGSGKTSLLRAILGQQPLDAGTIEVAGHPARRGDRSIGYIPQQRLATPGIALRGRDLVTMGVDGHRFGLPIPSRATRRAVDEVIRSVGAEPTADRPFGSLSGGEQQRFRIAQAVVGDPALLLCDEPLSSLDLHHQRVIAGLIDARRGTAKGGGVHGARSEPAAGAAAGRTGTEHATAVLFVTHDVNPVLGMVDRVLYLAQGRFRIGTADEVLRSEVLSALYGTEVEVIRAGGRVIVAGIPDHGEHHV